MIKTAKQLKDLYLPEADLIFNEVQDSIVMKNLWSAYQKKFSYASDLSWESVMASVHYLYELCESSFS